MLGLGVGTSVAGKRQIPADSQSTAALDAIAGLLRLRGGSLLLLLLLLLLRLLLLLLLSLLGPCRGLLLLLLGLLRGLRLLLLLLLLRLRGCGLLLLFVVVAAATNECQTRCADAGASAASQ